MNEHETNLVRTYVHLSLLVNEAKNNLDVFKESRSGVVQVWMSKTIGGVLADRLWNVQKELRKSGISVWVEDDGGDIVYVNTNHRGEKARGGIKRRILDEDLADKAASIAREMANIPLKVYPYQVEVPDRDPYEKK